MISEKVTIKPFRGTKLGVIRLKNCANKKTLQLSINGKLFEPIGFDTYGHPIISEENFEYFKALKSIKEREGDIFYAEVAYEQEIFCIKRECYDSEKIIYDAIKKEEDDERKGILGLNHLKEILIRRKKAFFSGNDLKSFIIFEKYVLADDGKVYFVDELEIEKNNLSNVITKEDTKLLIFSKETHIPGPEDVCAFCGKQFSLIDLKNLNIVENKVAKKAHKECAEKFKKAFNQNLASQIVDSVYEEIASMEIIQDIDKDNNELIFYLYHTYQGDISIRIKNKVIEIIWYANFKPFNPQKVFYDDDIKYYREDGKIIAHLWNKDDAIKSLIKVKKV